MSNLHKCTRSGLLEVVHVAVLGLFLQISASEIRNLVWSKVG
jgi:hypothetical protein